MPDHSRSNSINVSSSDATSTTADSASVCGPELQALRAIVRIAMGARRSTGMRAVPVRGIFDFVSDSGIWYFQALWRTGRSSDPGPISDTFRGFHFAPAYTLILAET